MRISHRRHGGAAGDGTPAPPVQPETLVLLDELQARQLASVFEPPRGLRDLGRASWLLVGFFALVGATIWLLGQVSTIVGPSSWASSSRRSPRRSSPCSSEARCPARSALAPIAALTPPTAASATAATVWPFLNASRLANAALRSSATWRGLSVALTPKSPIVSAIGA